MKRAFSARGGRLAADLLLLAATAAVVCLPSPAAQGARQGLALCGEVLLPGLFPFFVLSAFAVNTGLVARLGRRAERVTRAVFRLPGACAAALVLGLVGGYPVGASAAAELYRRGLCTKDQAQRLLAMCNNSGPAFLFGVLGARVLGFASGGALLFAIHVAASLLVCLIMRPRRGGEDKLAPREAVSAAPFSRCLTDAVRSGFSSILNVCSFVIFFSVLLSLLQAAGILAWFSRLLRPAAAALGGGQELGRALSVGFFELTNGASALMTVQSGGARLVGAALLSGWGGWCVHFQTLSLLADTDLFPARYLLGKALHGVFSACLAAAAARFLLVGASPGSPVLATRAVTLLLLLVFTCIALTLCLVSLAGRLRKKRRSRLKKHD